MEILILTENADKTAPGIVFERLIREISARHHVDLITIGYAPSVELNDVSKIFIMEKESRGRPLSDFFISETGVDFYDLLWGIKVAQTIEEKYDIILCLISNSYFAPMIAGYYGRDEKSKYAVYSVDSIPAPKEWLRDDDYYKGLVKMMNKYLKGADAYFLSTEQMAEYAEKTLSIEKTVVDYLYIPAGEPRFFPRADCKTFNFVYTGSIYLARKADYLLKGFEKLSACYPNSKLQFVGTRLHDQTLNPYDPRVLSKIEFHPQTDNLDPYYENATALIDIDADFENDVYLSSKIVNYLTVNRPIISETGRNSPSRHLFKGINSVIQCDHDPRQLCDAMKKTIETGHAIQYDDRSEVIKLFDVKNVVDKMMRVITENTK